MSDIEKTISGEALKRLKGKKIVNVRYLSNSETKANFWYKRGPVLILDDGTQIIPVADDEGNESGVMEIYDYKGKITILPSIPVD